jgi:hypothetical protein
MRRGENTAIDPANVEMKTASPVTGVAEAGIPSTAIVRPIKPY